MSNERFSKLWIVNVISFILFIILCSTGLINWLVLPRGYEARGSFLVERGQIFGKGVRSLYLTSLTQYAYKAPWQDH
jgi:hypothetical protein